ncbi:hypothetical protein E4U43_008674 [Claviceps pusilla]|uniref:Aldose 1-epimerase n=1 Tax=Claviceps pusilla TaxID=123648 RepID=A0A9P7T0H7_9HYPO|nr:hypothetical protein E4U43_008674 [Claviceps pusilla]
MKWTSRFLAIAAVAANALPMALAADAHADMHKNIDKTPQPDKDGKYWIYGDDISAAFIAYGASVSNFMVKDRYGIARDIVAGFDNASYYGQDKQHPHFGGVPGRYANRIKNSTFEIDGVKYHVTPNEHPTKEHPKGVNTLHGGSDGWDWRNFTVVSHTKNSITFSIVDPEGKEGFPGEVVAFITYSLNGRDWDFKMVAEATTKKTPIMLSSHVYWNLDGFANNVTNTIFNHTLHMPYAGLRIGVDNILIPTGDILANKEGSVNDFWSKPKQIGASWGDEEMKGNCGFNCTGYDNCYINNRGALGPYDWRTQGPVTTLSSDWSGIRLDVYTDQDAFQMYSCSGQNGSMALKTTQGVEGDKFPRTIPQYGCIVLEVQDYIDGINNPEWMRSKKQIFEPGGDPYVLQAKYRFSLLSDKESL